jgi:hypothetical protein
MSIEQCLAEAVAKGSITAKGFDEYKTRMADAEALAEQRGLAGPDAYIFATTEAAKNMEARATGKRAQVQQTILAIDRAWEGANKNSKGAGYGLTDVFGEHVFGEGSGSSMVQQQRGNFATMQSIAADTMSKLQSRKFGLEQNAILPRHTVSALYGRDVSDPAAKEAAKAWDNVMTWWRDEMQRSGVFVRELNDWRLPQHFDSGAVKAMGADGFQSQMMDWFKAGKLKLRDWEADGQAYMIPGRSDDKAQSIFEKAYSNITTGGDASIEPGAMRATTMADRFGRRRAFEWATDEAWLEFNRTLGVGDDAIGELLVRHMDKMSKDLATAQVLGPDPDRAAKILIQMYQKQGGGRFWANKLDAIYQINAGQAMAPVSQRLAMGAQAFRQFLSSAQLGGAILSSTSDFGFTKATASWHNLSMTGIMQDYVKNLAPGSAETRAETMRSGLIMEVGLRGLHDAARDAIGDVVGRAGAGGKIDAALNGLSRITGRMSEVVIRAQGLAHHTQALRDAIGSQLMAHLGDLSPTTWEKLSGVDKRLFTTYGMEKADWDALRIKGFNQGFLDPAKLAREGEGAERDAAVKMLGAIAGVQRMAVPEGNSITRAMTLGATRAGTWEGEILRSVAQYKGFPMGSFLMHAYRAMEPLADGEGRWDRGRYVAGLMVTTTVAGAISLQLKNLAAGKDPEPMGLSADGKVDPARAAKFWANAFAQGGAGGIMGDQLKAMFSAQRIGDPARLATPTSGFAMDTMGLSTGNIQDAIAGRTPHAGREAIRFLNKYTPDVWYTRLAMDRLVWDTLTRMVDPDSASTFQRMEDSARKQQGTEYYWRPGVTSPRAPDLGRALQ